jgi:hypothetical protein
LTLFFFLLILISTIGGDVVNFSDFVRENVLMREDDENRDAVMALNDTASAIEVCINTLGEEDKRTLLANFGLKVDGNIGHIFLGISKRDGKYVLEMVGMNDEANSKAQEV